MKLPCHTLGIDIGSTTVKIAILNPEGEIIFSDYQRHYANIQETLAAIIKQALKELGDLPVSPVITGSGVGYLHPSFSSTLPSNSISSP